MELNNELLLTSEEMLSLLSEPHNDIIKEGVCEGFRLKNRYHAIPQSCFDCFFALFDAKGTDLGAASISLYLTKFPSVSGRLEDIQLFKSEYMRQGIGTKLMNQALDTILEFKRLNNMSDDIILAGTLSSADQERGNWNASVPFYESLARDNIQCYFKFNGCNTHYTAKEFLDKASTMKEVDSSVIYVI